MNLAEKYVVCRQLQDAAVGKTITKAIVNQNPHTFVWFALDASQMYCTGEANNNVALEYEPLLIGMKIKNAAVIGGRLYIFIGDRALGVEFTPQYHSKGAKLPKRHQLLLVFDDESCLSFTGSLGGSLFFLNIGPGWASEGAFPSVLSNNFSLEFFLRLIRETELRSLSTKAFLATKNRIPGLDNTILHEILWEAEVNPKSKMAALNEEDYTRIYYAIKKVFPEVIENGGLDTQKDIYNNFGKYITKASKNTLAGPCARCRGEIVKESYLGGVVYYCPQCQPVRLLPKNK